MSLFSGLKERLRDGLKRSQEYLATGLATVLEADRPIDDTLYEELEELLIAADLGAAIAADFTNRARARSTDIHEHAKLRRVLERQSPGGMQESLIVLDPPTAQNGFAQAQIFNATIRLSGVCITKLDDTAKSGIVVRIVRELKLPI